MPGVKTITWTESNDAKFLKALLVYANVQVDRTAAIKIAAVFGPNVPPSAILSHISSARRKFKDQASEDGPVGAPAPSTTSGTGSKRPTSSVDVGKNKKAKTPTKIKKEVDPYADAEDERISIPFATASHASMGHADFDTTPATPSRVIPRHEGKKRSSPREIKKVDYVKLNDPHGSEGEDNELSGEGSMSDGEDLDEEEIETEREDVGMSC
ncbi:hypothetical protein MMC06_000474 [Schaereria dolodes]|nr:hypothetical protein [Schaereria dolodes]